MLFGEGRVKSATPLDLYEFDDLVRAEGFGLLAGADEAGRGPLAGPVVCAAVVLPAGRPIEGLNDSKKLTAQRRGELLEEIMQIALCVEVCVVGPQEIDSLNILQASLIGMKRAVTALAVPPSFVLIDGNQRINCGFPERAVVKGDAKSACVAAASIVAKERRDAIMLELDALHPGYGFSEHMGYPTEEHREALARLGPSPVHRRSFRGVKEFFPDARVQRLL